MTGLPWAVWVQNYAPLDPWWLSTLAAAIPIFLLLGLLVLGLANAWQAALAGLAGAWVMAVTVFGMPLPLASAAVGLGMIFAVFRIVWLIVAAVFLYDIVVKTGQFDVMRGSVARLTDDRRLQAVLIAFCFGAFIEGTAGFGAPVAITAAFLVGLGFKPHLAAVLCLVANTAPVAWGSIGIPIRTLAEVTNLPVDSLSAMSGRILPPISLIIPAWLVAMMVPWRRLREIWPALLVIGGVFAVTQWFWSNFLGVELVDLAASAASMLAGVILLRFWKPRTIYRFDHDEPHKLADAELPFYLKNAKSQNFRKVARAWMPFALLSLFVMLWGVPEVKSRLDRLGTWKIPMSVLHQQVQKGPAVLGDRPAKPEDAFMEFVPLTATGTAVFLAAFTGGLLLGVSPRTLAGQFGRTVLRLIPAAAAIMAMLGIGFLTRYSGMDAVLGLAFTRAGVWIYPIFGTLLGWLGVALTGSDTASNVLFGNLQVVTADKLGLDPILMASANTTGGVMGKMVDAQSIVVAAAATGEHGQESRILLAVVWHSLVLALMVGTIVWLYAHVWPQWIAS